MIAVETPFRDFVACWCEVEREAPGEQRRRWRAYRDRHAAFFAFHDEVFGSAEERLDDALPRLGEVAADAEARFAALDLQGGARRVAELVGLPVRGRAIAFVGTFGPMAWLDDYDGTLTAFFALEKHPDPAANPIYAVHELAHLVHFTHRAGPWADLCLGEDVFAEGLAMQVSRHLFPGASPAALYSNPGYAEFEAAVDGAWDWAIPELLACLDAVEPRQTKRFLWPDWAREDRDVPEAFGYLVGDRVVGELLRTRTFAELACWTSERARAEMRAVLEAA